MTDNLIRANNLLLRALVRIKGGSEPGIQNDIREFLNGQGIDVAVVLPGTMDECGSCIAYDNGYCKHRKCMVAETEAACKDFEAEPEY